MYLAGKSTHLLPGRGLINPAFVIKIVPATDQLQQQNSSGRKNPEDDYLDNLPVGSEVQFRVGRFLHKGRVESIQRNELGDGVYVLVRDYTGKTHKIEGSRVIRKPDVYDPESLALATSPAMHERFLRYEEFVKL